jgi:thiamine biosynthesis protein ThiS
VNERPTIQILVNGEPYQIAESSQVSDLIGELKLPPERVAIELNLSILPRAKWAETVLNTGDKLEIVQFVGGGLS